MTTKTHMPEGSNRSPLLADQIRRGLHDMREAETGMEKAEAALEGERGKWIAALKSTCRALAEARADHADDNNAFRDWLDKNGFPEKVLSVNNLGRYIKLGVLSDANFDALMAGTERTSARKIVEKDLPKFLDEKRGDTPGGDTPENGAEAGSASTSDTPKKKKAKPDTKTQHAFKVVQGIKAEGKTVTRETLAKKAGVSDGTASKAMAMDEVVTEGLRAQITEEVKASVIASTLSMSMKDRFEAATRAMRKQLQDGYHEAVRAEVEKRTATVTQNMFDAKNAAHKEREMYRAMCFEKGLFTKAEWNKIQMALHPDHAPPGRQEQYSEIFQLLKRHEKALVKPEPKAKPPKAA